MDMQVAAGGPIIVKMPPFPGEKDQSERRLSFPRLEMEDLAKLSAECTADTGQRFVTVYELDKYASGVQGCDRALLLSIRKADAKADSRSVIAVGSIMQRCELASLIVRESLTNAEESVKALEPSEGK